MPSARTSGSHDSDTPARVADVYRQKFGRDCAGVARAPGRVNLLGEHVDYNDGFVLPAATDRATYVAFGANDSNETTLWADDFQQEATFPHELVANKQASDGSALPAWACYPAGVAWSLAMEGLPAVGMRAVYASDVPRGAGLSSSASVELAFAISWMHLAGRSVPPMELARLCQRAENQYVGVNCGIMDQAASACAEQDRVMHLDCRSLDYRSLPLLENVLIIVADTGVRHSLVSSAYNDRRAACEQAVEILKRDLPEIRALRDVKPAEFNALAENLPVEVERRARHVIEEIERTRTAVQLLQSGDIGAFGQLMNACHASLRDLYEVSCRELDIMTSIAQPLRGCHGSRLTGAGFGGCTVNLVDRAEADPFVRALRYAYEQEAQRRAEIYVCRASRGAEILR